MVFLRRHNALAWCLPFVVCLALSLRGAESARPTFPRSFYVEIVNEDLTNGSTVLTAAAIDRDPGTTLTYSLTGATFDTFAVDHTTGKIFTVKTLDYETLDRYAFTIRVHDGDTSFYATADVLIYLNNVNERAPVFQGADKYVIDLKENAPNQTDVLTVHATDYDTGDTVTYSLIPGTGDNKFVINENTGSIKTFGFFDYETKDKYRLTVKATDTIGGINAVPLSNTTVVTVNIQDVDDQLPEFVPPSYNATIPEDWDTTQSILTLNGVDPDPVSKNQLYYELAPPPYSANSTASYFDVRAVNGKLYLNRQVDFENLAERKFDFGVACYQISGLLKDMRSRARVVITVTDVNDNAPTFPQTHYNLSVSELAPVGTNILTLTALDKDTPPYDQSAFSLLTDSDEKNNDFRVVGNQLQVARKLDFDMRHRHYSFRVRVTQTFVTNPLFSDAAVTVVVNDTNDNSPVFSKPVYSGNQDENTAAGTSIIQVTATDADSGSFKTIRYSIISGNDFNAYTIDNITGEISNTYSLDHEKKALYTLTIEARDQAQVGSRAGTAMVNMAVDDLNDNAPIWDQEVYNITRPESTPLGTPLTSVKATDKDDNKNGEVSYTFDPPTSVFAITSAGAISTSQLYNYDGASAVRTYALTLRATDRGTPSMTNTTMFIFNIYDVNDNSPVFSGVTPLTRSVAEEQQIGTQLTPAIQATDADSGLFGEVRYSLSGDKSNRFVIDPVYGNISTAVVLDFEDTSVPTHLYTLQVTATDQAPISPRATSTSVTISVTDENDHPPSFTTFVYSQTLLETANIGTTVAHLSATDLDTVLSAKEVVYNFTGANYSYNGQFVIDKTSGLITLGKSLDYETRRVFTLQALAYNKNNRSLVTSRTAVITVNVQNVNDHCPQFVQSEYSASIVENRLTPTPVITLSAMDRDIGAVLTYSIPQSSNNDFASYFQIGARDGILTTTTFKTLDFEEGKNHTATISATDGSASCAAATTTVTIVVLNENDEAPVFKPVNVKASVNENSNVSTSVASMTATDKDSPVLKYKIAGGNADNMFSIDPNDGTVLVVIPADYEKPPIVYNLLIEANDTDAVSLQTGTAMLEVTILDVNDNPPIFAPDIYPASVLENAPADTVVTSVTATDADSSRNNNNKITFSIVGGSLLFKIGPSNGQVQTSKVLDREDMGVHHLYIQAADGGTPTRYDYANVTVTVTDINDNAPLFSRATYTATIPEDSPVMSTLMVMPRIFANDSDTGTNGQLTFGFPAKFAGNIGSVWALDQATGEITLLLALLDRETTPSYSLTLQVQDGGTPPHIATAFVNVTISDVNDNAPQFAQSTYTASVLEGSSRVTSLLTVTATDADAGPLNNKISFDLQGTNSSYFNIDPISGLLSTNFVFDYEKVNTYTLMIVAHDAGTPQLNSTVMLTVKILDRNDNAPQFLNTPFAPASVNEDSIRGYSVLRFSASDADAPNTQNSQLSFSLRNSLGKFGLLKIDDTTYEVVLSNTLDYESNSMYNIILQVEDSGSPRLSSVTYLNVSVVDTNDHVPVFQQAIYTHSVPENSSVPLLLVTVSANDADSGSFGMVSYSITGTGSSFFSIGATSGNITTKTSPKLDYEVASQRIFDLTVTGTDGGGRAGTPCHVRITVTDINDNPPNFAKPRYTPSIEEDAAAATTVIRVAATDVDTPLLSYTMSTVTSYFTLSSDGILTTTTKLPTFELMPTHTLTVHASDGQSNATAIVVVTLQNKNTNPPQFQPTKFYRVNVSEAVVTPYHLLDVYANDTDTGIGGTIQYTLTSVVGGFDLFSVGLTSGKVEVKSGVMLDREKLNKYLLTIVATDQGLVQRSDTAQVEVTVQDANDNSPVFQFNTYTASVREDSMSALPVGTVSATDIDIGINKAVFYSITGGNVGGFFNITNPSVGLITTVPGKPLNRELTPSIPAYVLTITATDGGSPPMTDTATMNVTVLDVNDNAPVFSSNVYRINMPENIPGAVSVLSLSSTDADIGTNALATYSILSVSPASKMQFRMSADGVLETGSVGFDREATAAFNLTIQVKDGTATTSPRYTDNATVMVTILDINDNSPTFQNTPYRRTMEESTSSLNASVLRVSATDPDLDLNQTIAFALMNENKKFRIEPTTGEIFVVGTLDREAPGLTFNSAGEGLLTFTVIAYDRNNTLTGQYPLVRNSTTTVTVTITDANDNAPVIAKVATFPKLPETTPVSSSVYTLTASDKDIGLNADIVYKITSGNIGDKFAINALTGEITVKAELSAETRTDYVLNITAEDQKGTGSNVLSSSIRFFVDVTDVNEHAPTFTARQYNGMLFENAPVGTSASVTVLANDTDLLQANRNIMYNITAGNTMDSFVIGAKSGMITSARAIDRETTPSFTLTVLADDNGTPPLRSTCLVLITIQDLNDNSPILGQMSYAVNVIENTGPGVVINVSPAITASDKDSGTNGMFNFSLSGTGSEQFMVNPTSGQLSTSNNVSAGLPRLDREVASKYSLTVRATDGGGNVGVSSLTVTILDDNDNFPAFEKSLYNIGDGYDEETAVGTSLIRVSATDSDDPASPNSAIHYTVVDGGRGHFNIGRTSGIITLASSLDRELEPSYILNVSATDGGVLSLHNYTTVTMKVKDSNDNPPIFRPTSSYILTVPENLDPGSFVFYNITATDADTGTNAQIKYNTVFDDGSGLYVDANTGQLFINKKLDYETKRNYRVIFQAQDNGSPSNNATATVDVTVTDANDNAPKFTSSIYSASFPETTLPPAQLLHFVATDADSGTNGQVWYSLQGNSSFFAIDNATGVVSLTQQVSADLGFTQFTLVVIARDFGAKSMWTAATATVTVTDINSHAPVFNMTSYVGEVEENDASKPLLVTVAAYEKDRDGKTKPITFGFLVNVDNKFTINPLSGDINAAVALDREQQSLYSLTVVASDGVHNSTAIVTVNILDKNDNSPVLPFAQFSRSLYENEPNGTVVVPTSLITGRDADQGNNSLLTYSIVSGNIGNAFACNSSNGVITVSNNIDRETRDMYVLFVEVNDNGDTVQYTSTATVTVSVLDRNDNSPLFDSRGVYARSMDEELIGGTQVVIVTATDIDLGSNARVTYGLAGGDNGQFRIEADTGVIQTVSRLDYEKVTFYSLNVSAHDNGAKPRYTYITVNVSVIDINDWTPTFQFSTYSTAVLENVSIDTTLFKVNASDGDGSAPNNQFFFEMTNSTPAIGLTQFLLHTNNGDFSTTSMLDRERWPHYDIVITATDNGLPTRRTSTATIMIDLLDVDDSPPVFAPKTYDRLVSEGASVGSNVVTLRATDKDEGTNGEIRYTIMSGDPAGKFALDNRTGLLTLAKLVDRETVDFYQLDILATDLGPAANTASATVFVNITDINDNIPALVPVCNGTGLTLSFYENFPVGGSVGVMSGTDRDIDDNALLRYRITTVATPGNPVPFAITQLTGNVTTTGAIDREAFSEYRLTLEVSDSGSSPLSTYCNLLVEILDVNDNPPIFRRGTVPVNVPENTKDVLISSNTATDADIGTNAVITYAIIAGNEHNKFAINTTTGYVNLVSDLDYENTSLYVLTVVARNSQATPVYNATYQIVVRVIDVNDQPPVFAKAVFTVNVSEFANVTSFILFLNASDKDMGLNAQLTYSIIGGNQQGSTLNVFSLNGPNLLLAHPLDYEVKRTFMLTVRATDSATDVANRLSSTATVVINVVDENDNPPHFINPSYTFEIDENAPIDMEFGYVEAMDADSAIGRHITYKLQSGSGAGTFGVSPDNGTLYLAKELDYEKNKTYTIYVLAQNILAGASSTQSGIILSSPPVAVTINVVDVNDNAPVFSMQQYYAGIPLNSPPPHQVIQVTATDADSGPFGVVRYKFQANTNNAQFSINAESGHITSNTFFANFKHHVLGLTVEAYDNLGSAPSLASEAEVTVYLLDPETVAIFIFDEDVSITQTRLVEIRHWITNLTGAVIFIESAKAHLNTEERRVNSTRSDVYVYAIDPTLNQAIPLSTIFQLVMKQLDPDTGDLFLRFYGFSYLKFLAIVPPGGSGDDVRSDKSITEQSYFVALITVAVILFLVLLFIILAICCMKRRNKTRRRHDEMMWHSNFIVTPNSSMTGVDQFQGESQSMGGDQSELIDMTRDKKKKKKKKKSNEFQANPIWVQPYSPWEEGSAQGKRRSRDMEDMEEDVMIRTTHEGQQGYGGQFAFNPITTVEEREEYITGPSAVSMDGMENNPLYESQELKMEMFYTSDSDDDRDFDANQFNDRSMEDLDQAGSDAQLLEAAIELEEDEAEDPFTLI